MTSNHTILRAIRYSSLGETEMLVAVRMLVIILAGTWLLPMIFDACCRSRARQGQSTLPAH